MATRIEKKFKRDVLITMNDLLQEISENINTKNKIFQKKELDLSRKIIKKINSFYSRNSITDEQIQVAVNGK